MGRRLIILFTNIWLAQRAGTEIVIRDLAIGALRRGHRPIVYTPTVGEVGQELRTLGVAVIDDLRRLAEEPDIIHAHHVIPCAEAVIRFPKVPAIYVCHAFEHWVEAPAHFPQIGAYVAIDDACHDRLVHEHGIDPNRVLVLPNAVDLKRVPPRVRSLSLRPERAMAFGKASSVQEIRRACEASAIDFTAIGYPVSHVSSYPEKELVECDLVFASSRAALEALCCGCAVIVCDARGIAELVTTNNFSDLRAKNFGLRSFVAPVTVERLIDNIRRYDRDDASMISARVRHEADLEKLLDQFDNLYADVLFGARRPDVPTGAHEAAVAQFLYDYLPRRPGDPQSPWLREREAERIELERCRAELSAIKRSRFLKVGRRMRQIIGLPQVY